MKLDNLKNKKVAVLGLGLEGKDLISFLLEKEAIVVVFDRKEEKDLDLEEVEKDKIKIISGENYLSSGLKDFDFIFRSPGVYRFLPEIVEAENAGVVISSAIKLFFDLCPAKIIGVTGTKGKGTTSTLIYEILKKGEKDVYLAGNIGKPYLSLLSKLDSESFVVMEMSSFQLIDLEKSPQIAVVLNITSDHLNWHKNLEEYVDAKKNIIRFQNENDYAVINSDYETSSNFAKETKGKVIYFSKNNLPEKYTKNLLLKGKHNWENVAAAIAVAQVLKIGEKEILEVLSSFKGLEHRLELVETKNGISFYNDSFATGPQPTIAAIESFSEPLTLILGGYDKGLDYEELCQKISSQDNIKTIILIGDIKDKLKEGLEKNNFSGKVIDLDHSSMNEIVNIAIKNTSSGGIILLSPAAASFDMFKSYKERGNQFKEAVKSATF